MNLQPISLPPPPVEIADETRLLARAASLLDGCRPGVLVTVDRSGVPHARWMATLSFGSFPVFYALTSPTSRKIEHIHDHPMVSWLFASDDLTMTLTLTGCATEVLDPYLVRDAWNAIADRRHAYFLRIERGVTILGTEVHAVECGIPAQNLQIPWGPETFRSALLQSGPSRE